MPSKPSNLRHIHPKGTKVKVFNGLTSTPGGHVIPRLEGVATITSFLNVDDYYRVRFKGERKTYARFVRDDAAVK